jgi:hypothetical protein
MTYQKRLMNDRYANTALSVPGMQQPRLRECADYLFQMDLKRVKPMTADHLKQEARKWAKSHE